MLRKAELSIQGRLSKAIKDSTLADLTPRAEENPLRASLIASWAWRGGKPPEENWGGGILFSEMLEVERPDFWQGPFLRASSSTLCAVYELASKSGAVVASLPGLMRTQHLWEFCDSRRQKVSFFSLTVFSLPEGLSPGILTGFQGQASPPLLSGNTGTALLSGQTGLHIGPHSPRLWNHALPPWVKFYTLPEQLEEDFLKILKPTHIPLGHTHLCSISTPLCISFCLWAPQNYPRMRPNIGMHSGARGHAWNPLQTLVFHPSSHTERMCTYNPWTHTWLHQPIATLKVGSSYTGARFHLSSHTPTWRFVYTGPAHAQCSQHLHSQWHQKHISVFLETNGNRERKQGS